MKYLDPVAFRQAIEERLRAGDPARISRERKRIAFDRLLARLVAVSPGDWLLKGGFALDLRMGGIGRATKDVDIEWRAGADDLADVLIEAAAHDAGDFFSFSIESSGDPDDRLGGSRRFAVTASLAARRFEIFNLDIGFGRDGGHEYETVVCGGQLEFAGIHPTQVEAVPLERQTAEKLHAYTRIYQGGRESTRSKDLIDLVLIAEIATFGAKKLRVAIEATFSERGSHDVPPSLPSPPVNWATPFRQLAEEVGLSGQLATGHERAAALLDPVLSDATTLGDWDPVKARWSGVATSLTPD